MIYGICDSAQIENNYKQVCEQLEHTSSLDGVIIKLHKYKILDSLTYVCNFLKERQTDIIMGIQVTHHRKRKENFSHAEKFIEEIKKITNKVCLGNTRLTEWVGNGGTARRYNELAKKTGVEWMCPFTHKSLCCDYRAKRGASTYLGEHNIPILCYCGYVLAGYLWDDYLIPSLWGTTLRYRNLYEQFGLTVEGFSKFLEPLNIISGVGGQPGIIAGSLPYLKRLNFKGILCSIPFNLEGLEDTKVYDQPTDKPATCGPLPDENGYYTFKRPAHIEQKNEILEIELESLFIDTSLLDDFIVLLGFKPHRWQDVVQSLNLKKIQEMLEKYREGYDVIVHCKGVSVGLCDLWQCTNVYSYDWTCFESLFKED